MQSVSLLTSCAFCSSGVGIDKSPASSAPAIFGTETMTDAIDAVATFWMNSALEEVCADNNCVEGIFDADG